jgi:hypothetical protein
MSTTHHRQHNLNHVRAIGVTALIAMTSCGLSAAWLAGSWAYDTYLKSKVAVIEVSQSREKLETDYRESLKKSGFRYDVNLKSFTDEMLKTENHKLQMALRSGK